MSEKSTEILAFFVEFGQSSALPGILLSSPRKKFRKPYTCVISPLMNHVKLYTGNPLYQQVNMPCLLKPSPSIHVYFLDMVTDFPCPRSKHRLSCRTVIAQRHLGYQLTGNTWSFFSRTEEHETNRSLNDCPTNSDNFFSSLIYFMNQVDCA